MIPLALLLFDCAGPELTDSADSESPPGCGPAVEVCNGIDDDCDGQVDLPLPADAPLWSGTAQLRESADTRECSISPTLMPP